MKTASLCADTAVWGGDPDLNKLQTKLRSQRGASILFALLLFLVCAAVGSVALAAGTAAAGRTIQLAKMDQRYYCVTSATELMRDSIEGKTVTVVDREDQVTISTDKETVTLDADAPSFTSSSILIHAAGSLVDTGYTSKITRPADLTFLLATDGSEEVQAALNAEIREVLDPDGTMRLMISSLPENGDTDRYTLQLTFSADRRQTESSRTVESWNEATGEASSTVITTYTTTLTWSLDNIKTGGGPA